MNTLPSQNQNHNTLPIIDDIEHAPRALQIDKLDRLVGMREKIYSQYDSDRDIAEVEYRTRIYTYLRENGIDITSRDKDDQTEAELAKKLAFTVSDWSQDEWSEPLDPAVPDQGGVRELLAENLTRYYQQNDRGDTSLALNGISVLSGGEIFGSGRAELVRYGKLFLKNKNIRYAEKVNGAAFGAKSRQLRQQYDVAQDMYQDILREQYRQNFGDTSTEDLPAGARPVVRDMQNIGYENEKKAVLEQGGAKAKWLNRYANMNWKGKLAVGAGLVGVGALIGVTAGAIGGAVATAGVGATMAYRFGRGYAVRMSKIYKDQEPPTVVTDDETVSFDALLERMRAESDARVERAQKIKRRAVYGAMGAIALGSAAGAGLHVAIDHAGEVKDTLSHFWAGYIGHFNGVDSHVGASSSSKPDISPADHPSTSPPSSESPSPSNNPSIPENDDTASDPNGARIDGNNEQSQPDLADNLVGNVSAGEGFYSVFGEMGVNPDHHAELMQEIGPKLQEMGVAYEAGANANGNSVYGWDMTGDLPPEANQLILQTAQEHGWMTDAGAGDVDPSSAIDVGSDGGVIESGEGMYSEFGQHAAQGMTAQDVPVGLNAEVMADAGPKLVNEGVAYNAGIGEHGNTVYGWSHTGDVSDGTHEAIQDAVAQVEPETGDFSDTDWQAIEAMLKEASADGNMDGFSMQNPALLNLVGPELQGYVYPDGSPVASIGKHGNWVINDNDGLMPDGAYQAIYKVLDGIEGMHANDVAYMNV